MSRISTKFVFSLKFTSRIRSSTRTSSGSALRLCSSRITFAMTPNGPYIVTTIFIETKILPSEKIIVCLVEQHIFVFHLFFLFYIRNSYGQRPSNG